jgi:lipoprotein-anchoring transpeptidase ErfK/SrfK
MRPGHHSPGRLAVVGPGTRTAPRRTGRRLASAAGAGLAALALSGPPAGMAAVGPPTGREAWTARVVVPVVARAAPRRAARPIATLRPVAPIAAATTVLAVDAVRPGRGPRRTWVRVLLPMRPNGQQGWIPADAVTLRRTPFRILIDQGDRQLVLFRAGRPVLRESVAVGTPWNPTPNGRFAVAEVIRTRNPSGFLGPVVFALTAHSKTLNDFAGGDGRIAMHGTSLPQLLGTRASHGCIRMENRVVARLARLVRAGTPVIVRE